MKSLLQKLVGATVAAGLCLLAGFPASAQDEQPGIVRISKPTTAAVTQAGHRHGLHGADCECQYGAGHFHGGCPTCHYGNCCCRNQCSQDMINYFRCKFGYFIPTGAGGAGVPHMGKYSRVYPQDPYYFDQRDGMAWAAQGYGIPMAVPLAPVVGHTYNYGWGTPSSRLTPVSRPAY